MDNQLGTAKGFEGLRAQQAMSIRNQADACGGSLHAEILMLGSVMQSREQGWRPSGPIQLRYAEALLGSTRRSGFAPGVGNCMCQKLASADRNSTPTYCLPSRARWIETTRHSIAW